MSTLKVSVVKDKKKTVVLRLKGRMDGDISVKEIDTKLASNLGTEREITIDVGDIEYINSYGSREWVKWVRTVNDQKKLKFINCTSVFLDYANMIDGFIPSNGSIESFRVPYYCEECEEITFKPYVTTQIHDVVSDIAANAPCDECGKAAGIDVVMPIFFKFLRKGT